jgi:hypothetical protein
LVQSFASPLGPGGTIATGRNRQRMRQTLSIYPETAIGPVAAQLREPLIGSWVIAKVAPLWMCARCVSGTAFRLSPCPWITPSERHLPSAGTIHNSGE